MSWLKQTESIPEGYWGPVTLLWCELTNIFFVGAAIYGAYRVHTEKLLRTFYGAFTGLAVVGIGSFLFHMTLKHEAQLGDELPMIWASSYVGWVLMQHTSMYGRKKNPYMFGVAIGSLSLFITVAYVMNGNPVFHQVAYAGIFATATIHGLVVLFHSRSPLSVVPAAHRLRQDARFMQVMGTCVFLAGFLIWNIDNICCGSLRSARTAVGYPTAVLLEGHGWWHILTGLGAYWIIVSCEVIVSTMVEHPDNFEMHFSLLPHLRRIKPYDPNHTLLRDFQAIKNK
ncbi:hypothetical protein MVES1_000219 [Malassezia vespertilionis]|uniref:uncharacterized protein n=1 Tax=Malassezia vespertilionis TaxID=2020962 RepID=UPI0024B28100|nr:uncharacterized protein MVES1_000219 [Malassezia vespertilionis]WFD04894.1 hypothetical protein MVES1_000219 [Malassezia vespertilionis]